MQQRSLWHVRSQIRRSSAGNVRLATLDGPVWEDELPVEREPTYRKGFDGWWTMSYCYPFQSIADRLVVIHHIVRSILERLSSWVARSRWPTTAREEPASKAETITQIA
jgi:hypothetical protein